MIKLKNKYDIGDIVYFIYKETIYKTKIIGIGLTIGSYQNYYPLTKVIKTVKLNNIPRYALAIVIKDDESFNHKNVDEKKLFATKKELLESL